MDLVASNKIMSCNHSHYKDGHHMTSPNTRKALESGKISYSGPIIEKCDRCGENIKWARIVEVFTDAEYKELRRK